MKYVFIIMIVLGISLVPAVFAENTLQNTNLIGESATISLDIEFGEDTIKSGFVRDYIKNHLDAITLTFYGDEIPLTEPELKITSTGDNFRIVSLPEGILIYGHKNIDLGNYKINIYLATDDGLHKFSVTTAAHLADDKVVKTEPKEEKAAYVPDLKIVFSHDFKTYWKDTFNIDVQTYDGRINPKATGFEGRLDNANVTVIISIADTNIKLSGVTKNGNWDGAYYFVDNISAPGEYIVDVIVSYLNQTVSKSSSMFVIGTVGGGDGVSNHAPIAFAGNDATESSPFSLDGTGSSDPDGNTITYSWVRISGITGTFDDNTLASPTFTTASTGIVVFELTVTDPKGLSATDTITINVNP